MAESMGNNRWSLFDAVIEGVVKSGTLPVDMPDLVYNRRVFGGATKDFYDTQGVNMEMEAMLGALHDHVVVVHDQFFQITGILRSNRVPCEVRSVKEAGAQFEWLCIERISVGHDGKAHLWLSERAWRSNNKRIDRYHAEIDRHEHRRARALAS